jgi:uncharacterized protein (DUF2147 family)
MQLRYVPILLPVFILMAAQWAHGAERDAILGFWSIPEDEARFEIYRCGVDYCGRLSYLKEPLYPATNENGMGNKPLVDRKNPNPSLRQRPLLGLTIFQGFHYVGDSTWEGGRIYNPDDGRVYRGRITLWGDTLKMRGYIGLPLLGRTQIWTRPNACAASNCENEPPATHTSRGKLPEAPSG